MQNLGLSGRLTVITGAAQGIGEALAHGFAEHGCPVALIDYAPESLEQVAKAIRSAGGTARTFLCDLRDVAAVRETAERIRVEMGVPETLVNNAAWTATVPFLDVTPAEWEQTHDTGLKGLFFLSQAVARQMVPLRRGTIIHMGSQLGVVAVVGRSAYGAMKGGVHNLTRYMALELGPHGIRVNAIAPCLTDTVSRRNMLDDPKYIAWVKTMLPIGRWAQPGDVVGPALFLASDLSAMVTGHVLMMDGGWTIQ